MLRFFFGFCCRGGVFGWWVVVGLLGGGPFAFGQVVINEIHYDPEPKTERVEFLELYNAGDQAQELSQWQFARGIDYTFPENSVLPPGGYLVLTEHAGAFDAKFGDPSLPHPVTAFGEYAGQLSNQGERIRLVDAEGAIVDEVVYQNEFPWPIAPNGEGESLELVHPSLDNRLPGSWRASQGGPTPGRINSVFAENPPPQVQGVAHSPEPPAAGQEIVVTVQVRDADGVQSVTLEYQVVRPGQYVPAYLAKPTGVLLNAPNAPWQPNPAYHNPARWTAVSMRKEEEGGEAPAGDSIYTGVIPGQVSRTLVRYRITARDTRGAAVTVPYPDDASLNFACFVYDGVPDYVASRRTVHPAGVPYTHPKEVLTSLPVYFLLTTSADFNQCVGYSGSDRIPSGNYDARSAFNWSGTFVYDGKVYDNVRYRLRQRNDRYGGEGKRSFRFRFNRGNYVQFHDLEGNPYPSKWRTLNTHKMRARGGANFGLYETMNNFLWNLIGVPAPRTHWAHFRVVQGPEEASPADPQYFGDFYGLIHALEDYDARFIEGHGLPAGNLYKLISHRTDGRDVQRYQGKDSVTDASDFANIIFGLRPTRDVNWLNRYVNYEHWSRYHAVVEAVRHYDVQPNTGEHLKNRAFLFVLEDPVGNPLGRLHTLPWDSDTSWGPNWNAGVDFAHQALFERGGSGREALRIQYRNSIREFRDLVWQEDQINPMIDRLAAQIEAFVLADRDRWTSAPSGAGRQTDGPLEAKVQDMKRFAWQGGSWTGGNDPPGEAADRGISGRDGRAAYLDWLANDPAAPLQPALEYIGLEGFPADGLRFRASPYRSPPSANQPLASMEWRVAEVTAPDGSGFDPQAPLLWEWNVAWTSGELDSFQEEIRVPSSAVAPGRSYRVRVRMTDATRRRSSWSEPFSFTASSSSARPEDHLVINEIMHHPALEGAEFIEIHNTSQTHPFDLTGFRLAGVNFNFPDGARIDAGGFVVVAGNLAAFAAAYGADIPVVGEYPGRLQPGGERLRLLRLGRDGAPDQVISEVSYGSQPPWPESAQGQGPSLQLIDPTQDTRHPANWTATAAGHPEPHTPGAPNSVRATLPPFAPLWINEWMASNGATLANPSDGGFDDWIELYNAGSETIDLSGYTLTDDLSDPARFVIPSGVVLPPQGFLLVWASGKPELNAPGQPLHTNFRLSVDGEAIGLYAPDGTPVDVLTFSPQERDVSQGRFPDGAPAPFTFMVRPTPGAPNLDSPPGSLLIDGASLARHPSDGSLSFAWPAEPGRSYRVEFTDGLERSDWMLLLELTAESESAAINDPSAAGMDRRFYRILLLPE